MLKKPTNNYPVFHGYSPCFFFNTLSWARFLDGLPMKNAWSMALGLPHSPSKIGDFYGMMAG